MNQVAMQQHNDQGSSSSIKLVKAIADRFQIDEEELFRTLSRTAFRQRDGSAPTHEQMIALLVVANEYGLNPFTKEIYAFNDSFGGIVPVVGVDGWIKIVNSHRQYAGMEFIYADNYVTMSDNAIPAPQWIECVIHRHDLKHPIKVREYLDETYRPAIRRPGPWQSHPKRMLRHKAMIQAARVAFGFSGIYEDDEAQRIIEAQNSADDKSNVVEIAHARDAQASSPQPAALPEKEKYDLAGTLNAVFERCRTIRNFAPGKAWIEERLRDKPDAKAYALAELQAAEEAWQQQVGASESAEPSPSEGENSAPPAPASDDED